MDEEYDDLSDDLDLGLAHDQSDIDQAIRINELRETARELADGEMTEWEDPDCPPGIQEQFWRNVVDFETKDSITHFQQLQRIGIDPPPPEELSDEEITAQLWEVIHGLAKCNVFLSQTDHLSDRELYEHLWHESMREAGPDFPPESGWNCHLDILGGCSEQDLQLHLKYYANEKWREDWHRDWPDDVIPPHVDPPYDRDSKLPKAEHPHS